LRGQPLNHQLTSRKAKICPATRHVAVLPALCAGGRSREPDWRRVAEKLPRGIEIEIWSLDEAAFGSVRRGIPPPLGSALWKLKMARV